MAGLKRTICLILLILFLPCIAFGKTGIIVAMSYELDEIKKDLEIEKSVERAKRRFYSGKLYGRDIVLVRSPMGKVNNAATAQILLSEFDVRRIISLGPAGAVDKALKPGDAVVASEVYQHDFGAIKAYGFTPGRAPDGSGIMEKGHSMADKTLRELALKATFNGKLYDGVVVTGDQFIASDEKREWLEKTFKAAAVDTGAAAIAQVSYANGIPWCIIRVITDGAEADARQRFDESIYKRKAIAADIVKSIIKGLGDER